MNNKKENLTLGNIDVRKEWTYAGDVTKAMWTLVNQETEFEAIIGSGLDYSN
ncbi:MAG: GDP-mannose 4,6-dehydratase [Cyclobacteriaceae bacterium]